MKKENGDAAFPHPEHAYPKLGGGIGVNSASPGMTLRDWFAGLALQGLLVNQADDATGAHGHAEVAEEYAESAYALADAMLAQRRKGDQQ